MSQQINHSIPTTSAGSFFVLASGSPRRREFMALLELPFAVVTAEATQAAVEETPLPEEKPEDLVRRLSRMKAEAVAQALPHLDRAKFALPAIDPDRFVVLAADTIVVLGGQILGKPATPDEAVGMLKELRRQPHLVYSGLTVAAAQPQGKITQQITRLHQSQVWMRPYTDAEVEAYVASGDPLDKAGAYGIQAQNFAPVEKLKGCFASVMGFPLGELAGAFTEMGLSLPPIAPLCARHTGHSCCQE